MGRDDWGDLGEYMLRISGQIQQQTALNQVNRYRKAQTINLLEAHREKMEIGEASKGLNMADYEDKEPGAYWKDVAKNIKNPLTAQKVYKTGQEELNSASKEMVGLIKDSDQETRDMLVNSPKNKWFRNKVGLEEGKILNFNPDKQKFDLEGVEIPQEFDVMGVTYPPGKHNLTLKGPIFKTNTETGQKIFQPQNILNVKESKVKEGFDTPEQAMTEAKRMSEAEPDPNLRKAQIPTMERTPQGKYNPKLVVNPQERYLPYGTGPVPGTTINRKTGMIEQIGEGGERTPLTTAEIQKQKIDFQSLSKKAQTINGPVFSRLVGQGQILAEGVVNPITQQKGKAELDQLIDMRNGLDDSAFGKINNQIQKFNEWDQFIKYQFSDPKMAAFKSKVMANVDTLANIYSGGGTVTSDFKMKFAQDLFATGLSKEAFKAKLDAHKESVLDRVYKFSEYGAAGYTKPLTGEDAPQAQASPQAKPTGTKSNKGTLTGNTIKVNGTDYPITNGTFIMNGVTYKVKK